MTELLRERFVDRADKTRKEFNGIKNDPIRVSFYDSDGKRVDDVTRKEANEIAKLNPNQIFYFQDGNSTQRELDINQVNNLTANQLSNQAPPCSTSAAACSSPILSIFGGNGIGALANPIISPISSGVIGFDILNQGKNYTTPPFAQLIDQCGNGSGSKLETEISGGSVTRIIVKAPGDGYLSGPDGSFGGGGRTTIPAPARPLTPSITLGPTYPVILEIEDIDIINPGFGYQPGDKIIVTPDRGAVLEPVIDNGRIIKINVIKPGVGFDDFPIITTNSPTGYNLSSRPIFKVRRLNEQQSFIPPPGATIISVVDCVGIIPPEREFDRVPR